MKLFLSFLLLLTVSCGKEQSFYTPNDDWRSYLTPEAEFFIQSYVRECSLRLDTSFCNKAYDIPVYFADLSEWSFLGYCQMEHPEKAVFIDYSVKDSSSLELTIFHEFGHCHLGQEHREAFSDGDIRIKSIMNKNWFSGLDNPINKQFYLDDLFYGSGNPEKYIMTDRGYELINYQRYLIQDFNNNGEVFYYLFDKQQRKYCYIHESVSCFDCKDDVINVITQRGELSNFIGFP